jgi:DNA replication protein
MMTSNRPLEDWGKLIGDVPAATAILDRFLHHAEIITLTGRSYRLRNQSRSANGQGAEEPKPAKAPPGSAEGDAEPKPAKAPPGSAEGNGDSKPAKAPPGSHSANPQEKPCPFGNRANLCRCRGGCGAGGCWGRLRRGT